jgi:hypothetical protein
MGWDWVHLICGHYWPIAPAQDDRWWWFWSNLQRKTKYSEKTCPVPLCPPQIPHDVTRAWTGAAAVGNQRLIAWAMARPYKATDAVQSDSIPMFRRNVLPLSSRWSIVGVWVIMIYLAGLQCEIRCNVPKTHYRFIGPRMRKGWRPLSFNYTDNKIDTKRSAGQG